MQNHAARPPDGGRASVIRIALIDDQPILIEGLKLVFAAGSGFEIVAVGRNAAAMVETARRARPDVILVDPGTAGDIHEALRQVNALPRAPAVIVFTAGGSDVEAAVRFIEDGARGYVLKNSAPDELIAAIGSVLSGEIFVSPSFATRVIVSLRQAAMRSAAADTMKFSVREDQIVRLLQCGRTNREIAQQLRISEKTVKHYMTLLMRKLNVRNRLEVIIAARQMWPDFREAASPPAMHH